MDLENIDFSIIKNTENKIVIWGTGDLCLKLVYELKIDVEKQVVCFIESQPKKSSFIGKMVLPINDYIHQYSNQIKNNVILIASSYVKDISKLIEIHDIEKNLLYDGYGWYMRMKRTETVKKELHIYKYKDKFEYFLSQNHSFKPLEINENNEIVIFIKWWGYTLIPYYQITLGILLKLNGMKVKFLLDDYSKYDDYIKGTEFLYEATNIFNKYLDYILKIYSIPYEKLSDQQDLELNESENKKVQRSLYYNKVWHLRKIVFDSKDTDFYSPIENQLLRSARKIKGYLLKEKPRKVFVFTGAHAEFAILNDLCNLYDIKTYSSENFRDSYSYSIAGPTVFQKDISVFNNINLPISVKKYLTDVADKHLEQINKTIGNPIIEEPYAVIPLNIFWDSAAFTENDAFKSFDEWLYKTINFLINECQITVVVRQHPSEKNFGTGMDLKEKLYELFGNSKKFIYISSENEINTYTLLKYATLILPNTSTVGIESAMLGKTVIVKNDVYYHKSGFVLSATTEAEYFDYIQQEIYNPYFFLNKKRVYKAKLYYALSNIYEIPKTFGHDTEDVLSWMKLSLDDLLKDSSVNLFINSIKEHKSLLTKKLGI